MRASKLLVAAAVAPLFLTIACSPSAPSNAKQPAPPQIKFFAMSGGERNPAYLSIAPCPLGGHIGRLAYIDTENGNEPPQIGCWRKFGDEVILDIYTAKPEGIAGNYSISVQSSRDSVSGYRLMAGGTWPADTKLSQLGFDQAHAADRSKDQVNSEEQINWYSVNGSFSACQLSAGPAKRMRDLIDEGREPVTKDMGLTGAPYAVEVGFHRNNEFSYRTYYRSQVRCEREQTTEGQKAGIPAAYQ